MSCCLFPETEAYSLINTCDYRVIISGSKSVISRCAAVTDTRER